jgi:two-component system phosphate regulon sensor histidine kinase PhoR
LGTAAASFLAGFAFVTRGLAGRISDATFQTLQERVPLAALVLSLALATLISRAAGRWVSNLAEPLTQATKRLREGDLAPRPAIDARDLGALPLELHRLSGSLSQTMNELRGERDLQAGILEGMQEGVLLLDAEGRIMLLNAALREMLLLRDDVIGSPFIFALRHAELKELFDLARRKRRATQEIELSGLKPRRLLVRAVAQGDRVLAVFVDVTEVRRLESLRRDFVANVSHELRTPVTSVLSAAETLRGVMQRDPESAMRFLDIIERNADRLQRLIEDLLDLSRIESKEFRLKPERVELAPFAAHIITMFRQKADDKRITLATEVPVTAAVVADRRALEQVVTNLVDNAVKYCSEGCKVTLRVTLSEGKVRLSVEDTGAGIGKEHLPRLFERFYRVDAGRSRAVGGTGLGLSIVKHLVEAMGGSIGVESEINKGSVFHATLPMQYTAAPESEPDTHGEAT